MIEVGSLVRIKNYEDIKGHYDFVDEMEKYCGKYLILNTLHSDPDVDEKFFYIKGRINGKLEEGYLFYESMLEEVDLEILSNYIIENADVLREVIDV